jgi:cytochrome c oxidase assembly protein subunit 15
MFLFPLRNMVGGIFYEHGHRLIASAVGFLTIILAAWTWRAERRRWVRFLGVAALGAVVMQGVLGGVTVLFFLPTAISTAHAGLAQIFFCITVSIALVTSKSWTEMPVQGWIDDRVLRRVATATTAIIYTQILIGATMRHSDAGLAIPDFPLVFGGLVPHVWTSKIAIHYAHRVGALFVSLAIAATAGHVFYHHRGRRQLVRPAILLCTLLAIQVTLGAFIIWSQKDVTINTAHVITGALTLATSLVLTLRTYRYRFDGPEPARVRASKRNPASPLVDRAAVGGSGARA